VSELDRVTVDDDEQDHAEREGDAQERDDRAPGVRCGGNHAGGENEKEDAYGHGVPSEANGQGHIP